MARIERRTLLKSALSLKKRDLNIGLFAIGQSAFKAIATVAENCKGNLRYAYADEDETSAKGLPEGVFIKIRKHQFKKSRRELTWADSREQRKIDKYVNGLDVNIFVLSPPAYDDDDYKTYALVADYGFFSNKRKPYAKRVLIAHENAFYEHERLPLTASPTSLWNSWGALRMRGSKPVLIPCRTR